MIDLTLRCPVCGDRADMCFAHGDDWKKRPLPPVYARTEAQLRAGVNEFTEDDPPPYPSLYELARRAKSQAAAPDYDEEAIRDALWALVEAVLEAKGAASDAENRLAELNVIARAERDEALRTLRDIAAVDPEEWPYDDGWACVEHIRRIASRAATTQPAEEPT